MSALIDQILQNKQFNEVFQVDRVYNDLVTFVPRDYNFDSELTIHSDNDGVYFSRKHEVDINDICRSIFQYMASLIDVDFEDYYVTNFTGFENGCLVNFKVSEESDKVHNLVIVFAGHYTYILNGEIYEDTLESYFSNLQEV